MLQKKKNFVYKIYKLYRIERSSPTVFFSVQALLHLVHTFPECQVLKQRTFTRAEKLECARRKKHPMKKDHLEKKNGSLEERSRNFTLESLRVKVNRTPVKTLGNHCKGGTRLMRERKS